MTDRATIRRRFASFGPYALVVLAIALPWFLQPGYIFLTDFAWGPNMRPQWQESGFLLDALAGGVSLIIPRQLVQKLFVASVLLLVLLGGRKIARNFVDDGRLVFMVALFSLFNPFVYDRLGYGQVGVIAALGFTLFAVGELFEYAGRGEGRLVRAGIWSGLAIMFSAHFIFFLGALAVPFFVAVLKGRTRGQMLTAAAHFTLMAAVALIINANWMVSTVMGDGHVGRLLGEGIQRQDLVAFRTSGDTGIDALRNVVMMSGFWGKDQLRYPDMTSVLARWGLSFLVLLPFFAWGAVTGWRQKKTRAVTVGLSALFAVAAVLAVGIRCPVAREITVWLFDHVPFYRGLRETQKWAAVLVVIYAVFLSLGVRSAFSGKFVARNRLVASFFLICVVVMQAPLLLFGMSGQVRAVEYPEDWKEIDERIVAETGCENHTLFLPWHLYMRFGWAGNVIGNPAHLYFTCPVSQGSNMEWGGIYDNSLAPSALLVYAWLESEGETGLLHGAGEDIGHVILAKEADWEDYDWINGLPELRLVRETETLKLYEVIKE